MPIKDVEDLRIYRVALELLPRAYQLASTIEIEDRENARNVRKTAAQIAPQIAEGFGKRGSVAEFKRYLSIAIGSSDEMVTHLKQTKIICRRINTQDCDALIEEYRGLSRQMMATTKRWS